MQLVILIQKLKHFQKYYQKLRINMAKISVLEEAVKKLKYNNMVLLDKRSKCSTNKQVKEIDKQLAQNKSMILDYEYRIKKDIG